MTITDNRTVIRQSNIELLRIIAMSMIVIHHILIYCFQKNIEGFYFLNSLVVGGVNLFTLISGYFGIKLKWKSIINIISITLFYSILSFLATLLIYKEPISVPIIVSTFFPIDSEAYWYVTCYFFLMLLSPLINTGLKRLSRSQLLFIMGALVYINCFSSWIFQNAINPKGYTTMQLIFIYCIGYIIRNYITVKRLNINKLVLGGVISYVIIALITPYAWRFFYYNNPFVVVFSICIFLFVMKFHFTNHFVNSFAKSMLAVYLIQEGLFGRKIYNTIYAFQNEASTPETAAIIMLYFFGLFILAFILEWVRLNVFNKLNNLLGIYLETRLNLSQS